MTPEKISDLDDCYEQVQRGAMNALQSYSFWIHCDADEVLYAEVLNRYEYFFKSTLEAHLTTMVISLDCLFNPGKNRQDFRQLLELANPVISEKNHALLSKRLDHLEKMAKPIKILRNHAFGHVAKADLRRLMESEHAMTHEHLMTLCYEALKMAKYFGKALGRDYIIEPDEVISTSLNQFRAMIKDLGGGEAADAIGGGS